MLVRQVEMKITNRKTTPQACKEAEITVQTYSVGEKSGRTTCGVTTSRAGRRVPE
jgi:hypothetical protein